MNSLLCCGNQPYFDQGTVDAIAATIIVCAVLATVAYLVKNS